jgi:hypothetical protein
MQVSAVVLMRVNCCCVVERLVRDEDDDVGEFRHFAVIFHEKCVRIGTNPKKTGKNLWKAKNWD